MNSPVMSDHCLCGSVQLRVSGAPEFAVICYCNDCQQISGGGPFPQAAFRVENVMISGPTQSYDWASDAGNTVSLTSCSKCCSPIFKTTSKLGGIWFVAQSLCSAPAAFETAHVAYSERCPAWGKGLKADPEKG